MDKSSFNLVSVIPALKRYAQKLTRDRDRAEDLLQDTLLKAWEKQHQFEPGTNLAGWCTTIMYHHFLASIRRKPMYQLDDNFDQPMAESVSSKIELTEVLVRIDTLPLRQRDVVELAALEFSQVEISNQLNIPVGTVKSLTHRARKELRAWMR